MTLTIDHCLAADDMRHRTEAALKSALHRCGCRGVTPSWLLALLRMTRDEREWTHAILTGIVGVNASYFVSHMAERGYLTLTTHPVDGRVRLVALTPAGREIVARVEAELARAEPAQAGLAA